MRQLLALACAGVLAAIVAGCGGGGGGGGGTTPPPTQYIGVADARGLECSFLVGAISPGHGSESSARTGVRQLCDAEANKQAAGAGRGPCRTAAYSGCASVVVGQSSKLCWSGSYGGSTIAAARSSAMQSCQNLLGSGAKCRELVAGCATGSSGTSDFWKPSFDGGNGSGGVGDDQVGNEFGTTSTSGRNWDLTCSDNVVFSNSGNVVLPSVEVVTLPSESGTVTLDYDAYSIPDRFVVQAGGKIEIDTHYVGSRTYTVSQVNAVLARYGFKQTGQPSIIDPGSGSRSFMKPAGVISAVVRVYAPLTGTAWRVTLKFSGSSCPSNGNGPPPPPKQASVAFTITDECNDGSQIQYKFFQYSRWRDGDTVAGETIAGQWPSEGRVHVTSGLGQQSNEHNLGCTPGYGVCYGGNARNDPNGGFWGVGIDGSKECRNCCVRCPSSDVVRTGNRLTCN